MDNAATLRGRIKELASADLFKVRDKELIAALWIRLADLKTAAQPPLSREERSKGAAACKLAAFSAIYGTSSLEYVSLFTRYARFLQEPEEDPFLEMDCLHAEAIANLNLNREALTGLRQALYLARRIPDEALAEKKLHARQEKKIASLLKWIAASYRKQGRLSRALRLIRQAINLLSQPPAPAPGKRGRRKSGRPTESLKKFLLFEARLLADRGEDEASLKRILQHILPEESNPKNCLEAAAILFRLNAYPEATPYLKKASTHYLDTEKQHYSDTLRLLTLHLEEAMRTDNKKDLPQLYQQAVRALRLRRSNFIFAKNIEVFFEDTTDIYEKMLAWRLSRGELREAIAVIHDSYWEPPTLGHGAPDRESMVKDAALSRPDWRTTRARFLNEEGGRIREPAPESTNRIYFHVVSGRIYRLSRIKGKDRWDTIEWESGRLLTDTNGLLALTADPGTMPSLFESTVAYWRSRLFSGIDTALGSEEAIRITANAPLSSIPWPLFSSGARLLFQPGNAPALPAVTTAQSRFLSLCEDGATLPAAQEEHNFLVHQHPDGDHAVPSPDNDQGRMKQHILQKLPSCGIFHFAGHGYNHPDFPEQSGLILRGSPLEREQDNILSFQEIRQLDLSGMRLAFLNSCSSGRGASYLGGIQINAAAAFLTAGVSTLIVSCNPVLDSASGAFTRTFYTLWKDSPDAPAEEIFFRAHRSAPLISAPYTLLTGGQADI